ncbi:MAG: DNA repair protein RecN [Prevotellaceae bacterium]|nr:DNA repair protein RecN [Prevotellaceae bacterium]
MLTHLHISNYVLIDALDIDFADGFSALTGETGAGKSIIMGALGLLLGQRAEARAIKDGAPKCCVEAIFRPDGNRLRETIEAAGADYDPESCILRREVSAAGKSRAFINDTPVTLAALRATAARLVDIHSQHQNLLLQQEDFLLDTLDALGSHEAQREAYERAYAGWSAARATLSRLGEESRQSADEADYHRFRLGELEAAALTDGEQETLEAEARLLAHTEDIKAALHEASHLLAGEEHNMLADLRRAAATLDSVGRELPLAGELAERIESARIELADIAAEAENALENTDFDPARSAFVHARLDTIYTLEKKHRADSVAALIELARSLRQKLDEAENRDELLARAEKNLARAEADLAKAAEALAKRRREAARGLEAALAERLRPLGMPSVRLEVAFTPRQHPEASGPESAALLFSANAGVALQDAAHTASGGEVARLMLALKALLSDRHGLPTVIFDEIDTGVSGTMAGRMGQLMHDMGRSRQVVCITHLPQIAAQAAAQYRVYKVEHDGRTTSHIALLSPEERIDELATMLSGGELTEAARQNARSLLESGHNGAAGSQKGTPATRKTKKAQ